MKNLIVVIFVTALLCACLTGCEQSPTSGPAAPSSSSSTESTSTTTTAESTTTTSTSATTSTESTTTTTENTTTTTKNDDVSIAVKVPEYTCSEAVKAPVGETVAFTGYDVISWSFKIEHKFTILKKVEEFRAYYEQNKSIYENPSTTVKIENFPACFDAAFFGDKALIAANTYARSGNEDIEVKTVIAKDGVLYIGYKRTTTAEMGAAVLSPEHTLIAVNKNVVENIKEIKYYFFD